MRRGWPYTRHGLAMARSARSLVRPVKEEPEEKTFHLLDWRGVGPTQ